jgi:hypothetical protein
MSSPIILFFLPKMFSLIHPHILNLQHAAKSKGEQCRFALLLGKIIDKDDLSISRIQCGPGFRPNVAWTPWAIKPI